MRSHTTDKPTQDRDAESPSRGEVLKAELKRAARRARHHERGKLALLAPVGWLGTLHAAALGMDAADLHPLLWVGITGAGAAGVLGRAERRGDDLPWVPTTAGALWMFGAYLFGPYGWVAIILWVAGIVGFAVPYWKDVLDRLPRRRAKEVPIWGGLLGWFRRNNQLDEPEQQQPAHEIEPREPEEAKIWRTRVVPNNTAFTDTRLVDIKPIPDGFTAVIAGKPGANRYSQMAASAAVETIASAYQANTAWVAVEPASDGDASRARLSMIRSYRNLIDIPDLEDSGAAVDLTTGMAQTGVFFDGAPAHWQFWNPSSGAQMGLVAGDTGSGKSAHVSALLTLAHRCPLIVTALLDPQGGASQPDWRTRTPIYAEGDDVFEALLMLDFVLKRRAQHISRVPWVDDKGRERAGKSFLLPGDPDVGMPMIFIVLEEFKLLVDSPYGKAAFELAVNGVRTWRKAGGGLLVVNQNLGLGNFGSSDQAQSFRSNLISGGGLTALRTASSTDHAMVGLPSDPSKLPKFFPDGSQTHGLAYLLGVDRRPSATARLMRVRDPYGIASTPPAGVLDPLTMEWIEEYRHHKDRGRNPREATPQPAPPPCTSGDVQAAVEQVLRDASLPLKLGDICTGVQQVLGKQVPLREIPAALRALKRAGVVEEQPEDVFQLAPID